MPSSRHLLNIGSLAKSDVEALLRSAAKHFATNQGTDKKNPSLRGLTQINVFFESSTRTRTSFEIAGKRLGADVINIAVAQSAVNKGECLIDTAQTLDAMCPDYLVIRHPQSGAAKLFSEMVDASVINGGDGCHAHPTQALLDVFTMQQHGKNLNGLKVAICGDIMHSRVARSNIALLKMMGAEVRLVAPPTLMPLFKDIFHCPTFTDMDEAVEGVDIIMMLRLQTERMIGPYLGSLDEYFHYYGLTYDRVSRAKPDALIMHPGPINRGVEIDTHLADDKNISLILPQIESGVAMRQAILEWLKPEDR